MNRRPLFWGQPILKIARQRGFEKFEGVGYVAVTCRRCGSYNEECNIFGHIVERHIFDGARFFARRSPSRQGRRRKPWFHFPCRRNSWTDSGGMLGLAGRSIRRWGRMVRVHHGFWIARNGRRCATLQAEKNIAADQRRWTQMKHESAG